MLVAWAAAAPQAIAQISAFRFDSTRVPVGQVFHYLKSNRDGTHPTLVSVYVRSIDQVESFKWDSGGESATLVTATMDWSRFSASRLAAFGIARGKPDQPRGTLEIRGNAFQVSFLPDTSIGINQWPWHSYDFDLVSLGLALPHRVDSRGRFRFQRFDVPPDASGPTFRDLGEISVTFERTEQRLGASTTRFAIGGPGLGGTEGTLWVDSGRGHLVEFEIPIPDEAGFQDGRLRLQATTPMTVSEWDAFKRRGVGDHD